MFHRALTGEHAFIFYFGKASHDDHDDVVHHPSRVVFHLHSRSLPLNLLLQPPDQSSSIVGAPFPGDNAFLYNYNSSVKELHHAMIALLAVLLFGVWSDT